MVSSFESNVQKVFLISNSRLANFSSLLCYRNFALHINLFGLFSAILDFLFLFLLWIMTSYLINFSILENHARSETSKVSDLKIMGRWAVVDLRAKVQEWIKVNSQQLQQFIKWIAILLLLKMRVQKNVVKDFHCCV